MSKTHEMQAFPFVVDALRLEDIDDLMQIEQEAFSAPWSANIYRYELTRNRHGHYLALRWRGSNGDKGRFLGYGGFWMVSDEAHICTIAVRSSWRGRGLGEWIMLALLDEAKEQGALEVTLEARVSNKAALNLYRKLGFKEVGLRPRYYSDNNEDALLMTLSDLQSKAVQARLAEVWEERRQKLLALLPRLREAVESTDSKR